MTSLVDVAPDVIETAAGDLASIRSSISQAAAAAAPPTTTLLPAAADEVSAAVSQLFGAFGQDFQGLNAQAAAFHAGFVSLLSGGASAYVATDVANAQQSLLNAVNTPGAAANGADSLLGGVLGGIFGGSSSGGTTTTTTTTTTTSGGILSGLGSLLGGGSGGTGLPSLSFSLPIPTLPTIPGTSGLSSLLGDLSSGFSSLPFSGAINQTLSNLLTTVVTGGTGSLLTNPSQLVNLLDPVIEQVPGLYPILSGLLPGVFPAPTTTTPPPPLNPWVALFQDTGANLGALSAAYGADPFPIAHQILINEAGYAGLVAQAFGNGVQSFPGGLQVLPGQIEAAIQSAETGFNPNAFAQWFGANRDAFGTILNTALANAGQDFQTTIPIFQADAATAWQQLTLGNFNTAVSDYGKAGLDLFISGFDTSHLGFTGSVNIVTLIPPDLQIAGGLAGPIYVEGPGGALLPALSIPGMQALELAELMPPGSSLQHGAFNFSNMVSTLTNPAITTTALLTINTNDIGGASLNVTANFGLPLQLAFAVLGPPFDAANGVATVASYLGYDIQTGNALAFAGAIADSPAIVLNSFLNGQTYIDLTVPVSIAGASIPLVMQLPLSGLLVAPHGISASADLFGLATLDVPVGGTQFGGLAPFLLDTMPQQLAASITPAT